MSIPRVTPLAVALLALLAARPTYAQSAGWASRLGGIRARTQLSSPDATVRRDAIRALAERGEGRRAVAALVDALGTEEDPRLRRELYLALARRGDPSAVAPLTSNLADLAEGDRRLALFVLGAIGGDVATRALVDWLEAADVGDDAATALAGVGAPAVPRVLRALTQPAAAARAARVLGQIGDTRSVEPLALGLARVDPATRVAFLDALAALGDERAAPAVAERLSDPAPEVVSAALRALAQLGGPELAGPVALLADRGTSPQRAQALAALVRMAPEAAAPRLMRAISGAEPAALVDAAEQAMLQDPSPALVPALTHLAHEPADRSAALEALARVEAGRGLPALLGLAERFDVEVMAVPLALAVRRHRGSADAAAIEAAEQRLRAHGALTPRALAGDPEVGAVARAGLAAASPEARAEAAWALLLLDRGAGDAGPLVAAALRVERDAAAGRVLALTCLALACRVDPSDLEAAIADPATAPEALWVAAANLGSASPRTQARLQRALRRGLRAMLPRVRAGAALAIAWAGERSAAGALAAALDDPHDAVRVAVARALGALGPGALALEAVRPALAARARIESNTAVRSALLAALAATSPSPPFARGSEVLYARVVAAPDHPQPPRLVDVTLSDGRWLRLPLSPHGEVLVPSLAAGEAEVDVRLER